MRITRIFQIYGIRTVCITLSWDRSLSSREIKDYFISDIRSISEIRVSKNQTLITLITRI